MPESNIDTAETVETNENPKGRPVDYIQAPHFREVGRSLNPLVHIPFTGPKALYSYGRLALYGSLAYMSYGKARKLSYVFMGAAAVSIATSLSKPVV